MNVILIAPGFPAEMLDDEPERIAEHDGTRTLLRAAVDSGSVELVRNLLDRGADPRETTPTGETLIELADRHGRPAIASLLKARASR